MKKKVREVRMDVKGKVVNIGMDVYKRSGQVTAIIEGLIIFHGTCSSNYSDLYSL